MSESIKSGDKPPAQVILDDRSLSQGDEVSAISSQVPSQCTSRLAVLFQARDDGERGELSMKLAIVLRDLLTLDITFINRLTVIGLNTPASVVNAFGLDRQSIAKSFATMGPSHVLPQQMHEQTMKLVMFARAQVLNSFNKSKTLKKAWQQLKKKSSYNKYFETWGQSQFSQVKDFITDQSNLILAQYELKEIRNCQC